MTDIRSHAKNQLPGQSTLAMTAFSNLHDNSMVTMETNGLTNFSHRPSTFLPNLRSVGPFTAEKKAVKIMSYTLDLIELDISDELHFLDNVPISLLKRVHNLI